MTAMLPAQTRPVPARILRRNVWSMVIAIVALHVAGVGLLVAGVAGSGGGALTLGTGALAYSLGARHAFDVDHIAAIDNSTRALSRRGQTPVATGFFFSLGHSSVVVLMTCLLCVSARTFAGQVTDDQSTLHLWTGFAGVVISAGFLLVIAVVNIGALRGLVKVARDLRNGTLDEDELEQILNGRGLFSRILRGAIRRVDATWKLYPLGFLFGLGFDTATEIGLLVLAAAAGAAGVPIMSALSLAFLFTAGMCLFDSADGLFMSRAYGWALVHPSRKVFYNITMTAFSVVIAVGVGAFQIGGLFWQGLANFNAELAGLLTVAAFAAIWAVWRYARVENMRNPQHCNADATL